MLECTSPVYVDLKNRHEIASSQEPIVYRMNCSTCGSPVAERTHTKEEVITECSACDYYLRLCVKTGRVLENYSLGSFAAQQASR